MGRHKLFFTNANRIWEGIFKMDMEIALRATVQEGTKCKICYNYNSPQDRIYGEAAICSPSSLWGDVKANIRREHSRRKPVPPYLGWPPQHGHLHHGHNLPYSSYTRALRAENTLILSEFNVSSWSWWCHHSFWELFTVHLFTLFYKEYSTAKAETQAERETRSLSWHNCTHFFFFNFWAVLFSYFQVTESSNNNIFLKVKGLTMHSEIPPVFEQCTQASTNFWQKLFQVTAFLIPKSTCLMKMFILK